MGTQELSCVLVLVGHVTERIYQTAKNVWLDLKIKNRIMFWKSYLKTRGQEDKEERAKEAEREKE